MTPDEHFLHLAEFIKGVELSGGTTPHVSMTVEAMDRQEDRLEKLWFAGCYAMVYNWPTAEVIFQKWRPENMEDDSFSEWVGRNWAGIPKRKERKAVFRQSCFVESAVSYLAFAKRLDSTDAWPITYQQAYDAFTGSCRYMGRYIAIRWLEVMRRAFPVECAGWVMPDVSADGGEHPRKALALIYPADAEALLGGNSKANLKITDLAAARCLLDMEIEYGIRSSYYELQSLLCEYKQSALGRKQYPGKSIDTEMDYYKKVKDYWGHDSLFYPIRQQCFPTEFLGETQGWYGVRPELGGVLVDHGYTWSDLVYDYGHTTDFADPTPSGLRGSIL